MVDFTTEEVIRTSLSSIAIVISCCSLYFSRRSWLQSNRPIVTAFVSDRGAGNISTPLDLVVANSGNRPATNVRLFAKKQDIRKLVTPNARPDWVGMIERCFQEESVIPILRNGEELSTCFGLASGEKGDSWMVSGATIEIKIIYRDLEGRKFESQMPLKVYMRQGFGGAVWKDSQS